MRFADEQAFPLSEVIGDDEVEDVSAGSRVTEECSFLFLELPYFSANVPNLILLSSNYY